MRPIYCVLLCAALAGCASTPPPVWMRIDGRPALNDPVLSQQFQIDKTICLGDREKADLSGTTFTNGGLAGLAAAQNRSNAADAVLSGCMAQKGYLLVPADQVPAKAAELQAIEAQRQAQQTAQMQPPSKH